MMELEPFCGPPAKRQPPEWWPEDKPFFVLKSDQAYRDNAGRWRDHGGVVLNRRQRRVAKLPK